MELDLRSHTIEKQRDPCLHEVGTQDSAKTTQIKLQPNDDRQDVLAS